MLEQIEWLNPNEILPLNWKLVLIQKDHCTSIGWYRTIENEGKWFVWDNNESREGLNGFNDESNVMMWAEMPKGSK